MNMRKMFSVGSVALLLTACGDSFTPEGIAGAYNLASVNGIAMPASITTTEQGIVFIFTFESGTVTLRADGTYSFVQAASISIDGVSGGTENETDSGTYTLQEPATLSFTSTGDTEVTTATLIDGTITVVDNDDGIVTTLIFEKQ